MELTSKIFAKNNKMKTLQTSIEDFLCHCQFEKNLCSNTTKAYKIDLEQFLKFVQNNGYSETIEKLDKVTLKAYLKQLSGFKPKTIKRKVASIKAFLNEMEVEEVIMINPFRKMRVQIKEPIILPTVMNSLEVEKLINAVWNDRKLYQCESFSYSQVIRNIAVFEMLFATGMRVSELCNLKINDIDFTTYTVRINGKGNKERLTQVCNSEAILALSRYHDLFKDRMSDNSFFFQNRTNNRFSEQSVRHLIKKYVSLTGLTKNITPHTFRHSFATLLLEEDVDIKYIQQLLGHSSIMTTQIYTHVNMQQKIKLLNLKHPRKNFQVVTTEIQ